MAVTDNFNRTDATDLGANWTDLVGGFRIVSNTAKSENDGVYNWSVWTGNSWNNDQSSQITLLTSFEDCGLIVRAGDAAGGGDGYMGMASFTNGMRIYRRDNGSFTLLTDIGGTVVATNVMKLAVVDNDLELFKNSVSQGTALNDNTYASGAPGIYNLNGLAYVGVDDWEGTGESAGGASTWGSLLSGQNNQLVK